MWHSGSHSQYEIKKVISGQDLSEAEAYKVMMNIVRRKIPLTQVKELLIALREKGETIEEITGFARALRKESLKIKAKSYPLVDTCGTGGDELNTFNISTAAAFIAAGVGVKIAKHGNRSATSQCGSADVLEALGINIRLTPNQVVKCIDEIGIGFLFAPSFHQGLQYVAPVRKELGIRTIFNLLGPLLNPAGATRQVLGVFDAKWVLPIAKVLRKLGSGHAFVVHGAGGIDEISTLGATQIAKVHFGIVTHYAIFPEDFGIKRANIAEIRGGTPMENALIMSECLDPKSKGSRQDIALLNASAAIVVAGLAPNLRDGMELARESLYSGRALKKLEAIIAWRK